MTFDELGAELKAMGLPKFRTAQIYDWLHNKCVSSFEEMTNISKKLIEQLNEKAFLTALNPVEVQTSKIDGTKKYLFLLEDGNVIESVPYFHDVFPSDWEIPCFPSSSDEHPIYHYG